MTELERERHEAILTQRAELLARRTAVRHESDEGAPVLVLRVAGERYVLPVDSILEALPTPEITPLPGVHPAVLGIAVVHGEVRTVADLGRLLELPASGVETGSCVVLLHRDETPLGLRVDGVDAMRTISDDDVRSANAAGALVAGVTTDGLVVLDPRSLLAHPALGVPTDDVIYTHQD